MAVNISDIVDYYVNLLIIQYNQLPNAQATISLFVNELLGDGVYFDARDGYDVDTAVGAQLDVIAKYIGADRFFSVQELDGYFSFILYDDSGETYSSEIGYCDYTDIGEKPGLWVTYDSILSQTSSLTDPDFRTILKLKILQNNINSSDGEIDRGIYTLFGGAIIIQDNYDMTMNYIVDPSISAIISIANEKGILPKPMGVGLNFSIGNLIPTTNLQAWYDGSDINTITMAYEAVTGALTGTGTFNTYIIAASGSVANLIQAGMKIMIGTTDIYTVASVSTPNITTVEALSTTYTAAPLLVNKVSEWNDKSVNKFNLIQNTAAKQAIYTPQKLNNRSVITFDGTNNYAVPAGLLAALGNSNNTFFAVYNSTAPTSSTQQRIFSTTDGVNARIALEANTTSAHFAGYNCSQNLGSEVTISTDPYTDFHIVTAFRNGAMRSIQLNNGTPTTDAFGADAAPTSGNIGANQTASGTFVIGNLCELIIYNTALSSGNIIAINQYLAAKWNITIS